MEISKRQIEVIVELFHAARAVETFLTASTDITTITTDTMYRPPSWALREAADEMDVKDGAIIRYRQALRNYALECLAINMSIL